MYLVRLPDAACLTALPGPLADSLTAEFQALRGRLESLRTVSAWGDADAANEEIRPESVSRRNLFKSARISAADWYRRSRSFSSAFWTMSSNFCGKSGFSRKGLINALFNIASVITPDVSPRNGSVPAPLSYNH